MARIEVRGLKIWGHHGVHEDERKKGQTFWVDLRLHLTAFPVQDKLQNTVDYTEVFSEIKLVSEKNSFCLIETLAEAIGRRLVEKFDRLSAVSVRVRKRLRGADADLDWVAAQIVVKKDFRRE